MTILRRNSSVSEKISEILVVSNFLQGLQWLFRVKLKQNFVAKRATILKISKDVSHESFFFCIYHICMTWHEKGDNFENQHICFTKNLRPAHSKVNSPLVIVFATYFYICLIGSIAIVLASQVYVPNIVSCFTIERNPYYSRTHFF